jgi:putative GTP pyrophosphokinase
MDILLTKDEYNQYAALCECGMRTVLTRVENLRQEAELTGVRNPYATIQNRIKSYDSVAEKIARRDMNFDKAALRQLHDIAGIRIITLYKDDIYRIRDALVRQPSIELLEERDYVANPKENGYRSLHLIVSVHVYFRETTRSVPVEIQIRTKAMDLWASIEHDCNYKNDTPCPAAPDTFAKLARILEDFDSNAIDIRDRSGAD